ncbi:hypothetical protein Q4I30_007003 [Leishmania utingensis]|uniref:OCRE domain-containing protein n=1 Tax=Leishmania utingensis TaxID=653362 RepID=A0AAW3A1R0_9TRYP
MGCSASKDVKGGNNTRTPTSNTRENAAPVAVAPPAPAVEAPPAPAAEAPPAPVAEAPPALRVPSDENDASNHESKSASNRSVEIPASREKDCNDNMTNSMDKSLKGGPDKAPTRNGSEITNGHTDDKDTPVVLPNGVWTLTVGTPYYYSADENLYYHPPSCQFYDPTNGMWYDPVSDEWYRDEGSEAGTA